MVLRIDVRSSRELQAMLLAVRRAPKEIQAQIRKQTKAIAQPEWQHSLAEQSEIASKAQQLVLVKTGRVAVSNQNIRLSSATVGKSLSGGLKPSQGARAFEFGADRRTDRQATYKAHSRKGREYWVRKRHTTRQLPYMKKTGHTFYPAVAQMIPRIASLWAQTTVRVLMEAFEGKANNG